MHKGKPEVANDIVENLAVCRSGPPCSWRLRPLLVAVISLGLGESFNPSSIWRSRWYRISSSSSSFHALPPEERTKRDAQAAQTSVTFCVLSLSCQSSVLSFQ